MSKPVMLLGGGGVGGEISGPSDRADVPLVLAKPRSQSPLLWAAMLKAVSGVTVSENRLSQTVFADGGELTDPETAWSNSGFSFRLYTRYHASLVHLRYLCLYSQHSLRCRFLLRLRLRLNLFRGTRASLPLNYPNQTCCAAQANLRRRRKLRWCVG